jgi:putative ABC transport system permease protein
MMDTELNALQSMGYAYPVIFLLIGSIVIYMLLIRLVDNQRSQIGVLMALGLQRARYCFTILGMRSLSGLQVPCWAA